jgi:hypothetical protein
LIAISSSPSSGPADFPPLELSSAFYGEGSSSTIFFFSGTFFYSMAFFANEFGGASTSFFSSTTFFLTSGALTYAGASPSFKG